MPGVGQHGGEQPSPNRPTVIHDDRSRTGGVSGNRRVRRCDSHSFCRTGRHRPGRDGTSRSRDSRFHWWEGHSKAHARTTYAADNPKVASSYLAPATDGGLDCQVRALLPASSCAPSKGGMVEPTVRWLDRCVQALSEVPAPRGTRRVGGAVAVPPVGLARARSRPVNRSTTSVASKTR